MMEVKANGVSFPWELMQPWTPGPLMVEVWGCPRHVCWSQVSSPPALFALSSQTPGTLWQLFGFSLDSLKPAVDPRQMSSLSKSCTSVRSTNTEQLPHRGPMEGLVGMHVRLFIFNIFLLTCSCVCLFPQGSDGARRSPLLDSDEPLVYFYDDVRTLYEGFQRGIQVSSKHFLNLCD